MKRSIQKLFYLPWLFTFLLFISACKRDTNVLQQFDQELRVLTQSLSSSVAELLAVPDSGEIEKVIGSALIISKDGLMISTASILKEGKPMVAKLNYLPYIPVTLIGTDWETNVALLKLDTTLQFQSVPLIGKNDIEVGQLGFLVGSTPFLKETITMFGMLTHSIIGGEDAYDVPMYALSTFSVLARPGAPVFDADAQIIGIVDGKLHTAQMGMWTVIPLKTIRNVLPMLEKESGVQRGYLGIIPADHSIKNKNSEGVVVKAVLPNTPAYHVGLKDGDNILEIDGIRIKKVSVLRKQITKNPNKKVTLTIERNQKNHTVEVFLQSRIISSEEENRNPFRKL
ncbi:MAG: S1C family serine protease [bacterium]|nr:S1C family serine protease [bacterium]